MIGLLLAAAAALVAAFVLGPAALLKPTFGAYDSDAKLRDAMGSALVEYWRSGTPAFPARLTTLVDYWFQWHAIKVAISGLAVIVFALLTTALWQRYLRGRRWYAAVATAATVSTVVVMWVLSVNIQVTALPLIPLLGVLPGSADGQLAQVLREMHEGLTNSAGPHAGSPALTVLLGEAERYYWVAAAISATLMVAAGLTSAHFWKRRFASDPSATRVRFMHSTLGVITALTACLLLLMTVTSALSALEPATSLLGIIGAG